jgi:C4-dicarboxylate-specific signal transduction histidine kinase
VSVDDERARLVEAARLASVGRVVPSVAHQLSTPIAAISLRAESLEHTLEEGGDGLPREKLQRYLKAIGEETQRCKAILQALREFARRPEPEMRPTALEPVCRQAALLVAHEAMRRQVELQLDLAEAVPLVRAQAGRIGQVLLSLLLNAIAASPQRGRVTIAAAAERDEVLLSVTDDGEGPSEAARARLYEPLASTHAPNEAAGLGLMACRAIVEAHGGALVWQMLGARGCRFTLRLRVAGSGSEGRA